MTAPCVCQNDNRCAACGGFLYARKLNANYYNAGDGRILHVPGFSGFRHRAPTRPGTTTMHMQGGTRADAVKHSKT